MLLLSTPKKTVKLLLSDKFLASSTVLTIATILSGLLGYSYQIMLGSMLSPANFAIFSAILSLYVFLASPFNVIYMLLTRNVAMKLGGSKSFLYRYFEKSLALVAITLLIPFVMLLFVQEKLNMYLGVTEWYILPLLILFVWLVAFQTVCNAFIQGMQMYKLMALVMIFTVFFKIIATSLLLGFIGPEILNGLLGLGCSIVLMLVFSLRNLKSFFPEEKTGFLKNFTQYLKINLKQIFNFIKTALPVLIASIAFAGMTQLDMFFVNYYLPSNEASNYAAASVFGKVIIYLPGGLAMALYPMVAANHSNQQPSIFILKKAILATLICSAVLSSFFYLFGSFIISFFYADKYASAYLILNWYSLAMIPMALILILENFLIAKGEVIFSWVFLIIFPLQIIALNNFHSTSWEIITIIGLSGLVVLMIGCIFIAYKYKLLGVWSE